MTKNEEAFLEHVAKKQGVTLEQVKRWPVSALEGYGAWQAATARAVGVLEKVLGDWDIHPAYDAPMEDLRAAIKELSDG